MVAAPTVPRALHAQAPAVAPRRPFHLELGGYYHALTEPYGSWRGFNGRFQYTSKYWVPILNVTTQTRDEGTQPSIGIGSYILFSSKAYAIVGVSGAPRGDVELFPHRRYDVALLAAVPRVTGLVASTSLTEFRGVDPAAGGRIVSVGGLYYAPRFILSGGLSRNTDRVSNEHSWSQQFGFQTGAQGRYWVGGGATHGREAYQVLAATPIDARFQSVGATLFAQRWLAPRWGLSASYQFERKNDQFGNHAYDRHGVSASYFIDF
jgi:YaiO family outer membrane protein